MRILLAPIVVLAALTACTSAPKAGPLGEGFGGASRIVAVDTALPPQFAVVELAQPMHVAVLLIIPGHSATLLHPRDSAAGQRLDAGQSTVRFEVPALLARRDSDAIRQRQGTLSAQDSVLRRRRTTGMSSNSPGPVPANAATFLLLLASPQALSPQRIIERTVGVSIPSMDDEALNAVAKTVRATLPEPRTLEGYYQLIELTRPR